MSFSKNIHNNICDKNSSHNQNQLSVQTPNKVNRISNLAYSQNKNQSAIFNLFSSGKLNRNIFALNNNMNCLNNKCNSKECECHIIDRALQNIISSPSTNYLYHSPHSFEKYMESLATERINVLKLVKNKHETKTQIQMEIKEEIYDNKENTSYLSNSNSNSYSPEGNKNINSQSQKSWMSSKSSNSKNHTARKSIYSKEHNNTKKNLLTEFEQNHIKFFNVSHHKETERESDGEMDFKKQESLYEEIDFHRKKDRERTHSFKEILNSPECDDKKYLTSEKKKRKIFECSDFKINKFPSCLDNSDYKSSIYAPTVFSTQKKEKKRHRKNSYQMTILQEEYKLTKCKDWSKEKISEISLKTGLSENKVYKWFWDQKNKDMYEKKRFWIRSGN
jgi:hypothetical protein